MLQSILHRYNPAVPRRWLLALAGVLWTSVGLMLCSRAIVWISGDQIARSAILELGGIALAIPSYRFTFSKIVRKNIERINNLPERACIFALTAWKGYLMIAMMVTLGISVRNSSIPKYLLSIPYTSMGVLLLMGSFEFYRNFLLTNSLERSKRGEG